MPTLESALEKAARAWDDGDYEAVRDAASVAVSLDSDSVEAHHYLAAALSALGERSQADRAWHEALALAPDDPEILLGAAEHLVAELDHEEDALAEAVEVCVRGRRMAAGDPELEGEILVIEARALMGLGDAEEALNRLESAKRRLPDYAEVDLQRGVALFELLRLDDAERALRVVLEANPREALAHWYLGLIQERRGDIAAATKHLEKARRLDPESYPSPVMLTEDAFDRVVEEALERLPEKVRGYLENVAVVVEPIPADDDLLGSSPPLSPTILGVFRGAPLRDKQSEDPWAHFPSSIVLYQRNLERACRSKEELLEEIDVTVLHEVGHFLGLEEADLEAWGLG